LIFLRSFCKIKQDRQERRRIVMSPASTKGIVIRRLPPDSDLLDELQAVAQKEGIALGHISGIGALKTARVGIFLPDQARYEVKEFAGELEICHLSGNISLKDGIPFVHAHIVLADREARAWGGHVLPGCRVFVAEVILSSFKGEKKERLPQPDFPGLALWSLEEEP